MMSYLHEFVADPDGDPSKFLAYGTNEEGFYGAVVPITIENGEIQIGEVMELPLWVVTQVLPNGRYVGPSDEGTAIYERSVDGAFALETVISPEPEFFTKVATTRPRSWLP